MTATTTTTTTPTCRCGTRHKTGTECQRGLRLRAQDEHLTDVVKVLRTLPPNTLVLLDERSGRASTRMLRDGESIARSYADGCADTEWGTDLTAPDGTVVRITTFDGGGVANSYGYRAMADWCHVVAAEGRVVVWIDRAPARKGAYGKVGPATDRLMSTYQLMQACAGGERYDTCWLLAARLQAALARDLALSAKGLLTVPQQVELDHALEQGWI